jgi:NaMN:DMB phosphoribosyltransferase
VQRKGVDLVLCGLREFGAQLIADEMGIGKTRQALVIVTRLRDGSRARGSGEEVVFQPVARLASVLQVRRISSPMTLAVWARINSYNFHRPHRQTHPRTSAD